LAQEARWNAGLYDDKHSFVWKMATGLLELLDAQPGERVLDLGCGTGTMAAQIAETGAIVTGTDRSAEMIRQAREKHPALKFTVMDARELEFAGGQFDAVFSNAALHWIKEPELVIEGIAKCLEPGGRFVAEFGGKGNIGTLIAACESAWKNSASTEKMPNPWYFPSLAEYAGLLEKHGFEVTFATLFDRPTPLEDGERGLQNFLEMFGGTILDSLTMEQRKELLKTVEAEARDSLWQGDHWVLDYRRLRVMARRSRQAASVKNGK
jgi:ubiquinone/menaquinone biosynthesis C-methylase UbiE